jgi:hypothetical protein
MRTTDDLNPEPPFRPFGPKVTPPAPPAQPEWKQVPGAAPGVQADADGRKRTNLPLPKG